MSSRRQLSGPAIRRAGPALLVLAGLLLAACGSTAQMSGRGADASSFGPGGADGLGAPDAADHRLGAPGTTNGSELPGTRPAGAGDNASGGGSSTGSTPPVSVGTPTGSLPAVKVGVYVDEGFQRLANSAGFDSEATNIGDGRKQARAIIDHFNKQGGLAGHRIEPVFAVRDSQSDDSDTLQEQQACSLWTEDNRVVAAVSALNTTDLLPSCLSGRQVPFVANNPMNYTAESFAQAPFFATPAWVNQTRMAPVYVERLVAQGFFRRAAGPAGPVVGLLRFDGPQHARIARKGIVPALRRHGLSLKEQVAISQAHRTRDHSASLAQIQNAVLRFQTSGVTHVLALDYGGYFGLFFLPSAEKNQYRPQYGLTTYSAPYALQTLGIPEAQLRNVSGMGWNPGDVDPRKRPPEPAPARQCRAIARAAGLPYGQSDSGTLLSYCETLFFLKAVADRAGTVQAPRWLAALEALGANYQPLTTFATRFGPGRRDGAAMARDFRWDTGCSCFAYVSRPVPIG